MPFAFFHFCRKAAPLVFLLSMYTFSPGQSCYDPGMDTVAVSGELKRWHNITLSFDGPYASETCTPNPFLDYRLNVTFVHQATGKVLTIPGYFAADGNASETSADSGHTWRCHFSPDELAYGIGLLPLDLEPEWPLMQIVRREQLPILMDLRAH